MNWRERRELYDNGDAAAAAAAAAAANDDDVENGVDETSSDFEAGEFLLLPVMSLAVNTGIQCRHRPRLERSHACKGSLPNLEEVSDDRRTN